jgi:hypothetical protein
MFQFRCDGDGMQYSSTHITNCVGPTGTFQFRCDGDGILHRDYTNQAADPVVAEKQGQVGSEVGSLKEFRKNLYRGISQEFDENFVH